jgi:hypothetical protein
MTKTRKVGSGWYPSIIAKFGAPVIDGAANTKVITIATAVLPNPKAINIATTGQRKNDLKSKDY